MGLAVFANFVRTALRVHLGGCLLSSIDQIFDKKHWEHWGYVQVKDKARRAGTLLPSDHPKTAKVMRIGYKIVDVATDGFGGGSIAHLKVCLVTCPPRFNDLAGRRDGLLVSLTPSLQCCGG